MSQLKHTPGPWTFNGKEVSAKDGTYYICFADTDTYNTPKETEEEIANCKLIAAAPDLLGACLLAYVKLTSSGECNCDTTALVLSEAINKAIK